MKTVEIKDIPDNMDTELSRLHVILRESDDDARRQFALEAIKRIHDLVLAPPILVAPSVDKLKPI